MPRRKAVTAPVKTPHMIPNPEWMGSEDQRDEAFRMASDMEDFYSMCPEEAGAKIPEGGAWIMVKRPPMTEYTVPPLSMWYAREEVTPRGTRTGNNRGPSQFYHKATILTPKGDLSLWPGEYTVVKDISVYFAFPDDHIHINLLGGEAVNPDQLFYLRSRGIAKKDAIKMLLGTVKTQDVAFVTVHPEYGRLLISPSYWPRKERLAFHEEWPGEQTAEPEQQKDQNETTTTSIHPSERG